MKVTPTEKYAKLIEVLDRFFEKRDATCEGLKPRAMVFVNAKDTAKFLDEQLYEGLKFDTGSLHGNLTQAEREDTINRFKSGQIDVMIGTDVAARGLDIENVALVVNYDFPKEADAYVHRVGRTGRIGNLGEAITFVSCDENDTLLEDTDIMSGIVNMMTQSGVEQPDWLQSVIDNKASGASAGDWQWGGKDARGDATESWQANGGGDANANANEWSDGGW